MLTGTTERSVWTANMDAFPADSPVGPTNCSHIIPESLNNFQSVNCPETKVRDFAKADFNIALTSVRADRLGKRSMDDIGPLRIRLSDPEGA